MQTSVHDRHRAASATKARGTEAHNDEWHRLMLRCDAATAASNAAIAATSDRCAKSTAVPTVVESAQVCGGASSIANTGRGLICPPLKHVGEHTLSILSENSTVEVTREKCSKASSPRSLQEAICWVKESLQAADLQDMMSMVTPLSTPRDVGSVCPLSCRGGEQSSTKLAYSQRLLKIHYLCGQYSADAESDAELGQRRHTIDSLIFADTCFR